MRNVFEALARNASSGPKRIVASDPVSSLTAPELAARVMTLARDLEGGARVVGLYGGNSVDWMVGLLGALLAGKTVVPLATFFSTGQLAHVLDNAGVGEVIAPNNDFDSAQALGRPVRLVPTSGSAHEWPSPQAFGSLVIYTSGSTGSPKGVVIGPDQLDWSAAALAEATSACTRDFHLSVLPLPLLLETICAILVPTLVGASTCFETQLTQSFATGSVRGIAAAFEARRPTTTVLVPQLLAQWAAELTATNAAAPTSLRFVAVGGAPVPEALSRTARDLGIPAFEGYGLSECSSVVAVNTPGAYKPGTVGRPLAGLTVSIEDGEIVVDGPPVMSGYLAKCPVFGRWRTGDLGSLDADGYLTVHGRKDNLIVTALGRNVSPEWIETMLLGDPRIALCCVTGHGREHLTALLVPSRQGGRWFATASRTDVLQMLTKACGEAPSYAVPKDFVLASAEQIKSFDLLTANGRFRRTEVLKAIEALRNSNSLSAPTILLQRETSV